MAGDLTIEEGPNGYFEHVHGSKGRTRRRILKCPFCEVPRDELEGEKLGTHLPNCEEAP